MAQTKLIVLTSEELKSKEHIRTMVKYLWDEEQKHFIEKPVKNHIFCIMVGINKRMNLGFSVSDEALTAIEQLNKETKNEVHSN